MLTGHPTQSPVLSPPRARIEAFPPMLKKLVLALALLAFSATPGTAEFAFQKRDDNLPARVPYVFPPPGTDPVRSSRVGLPRIC